MQNWYHREIDGRRRFPFVHIVISPVKRAFGLFLFCKETAKCMRSIDESFYKTQTWKRCRAAYIARHPLCEDCKERGLIVPSAYIHHIEHLTPENVRDPEIAYGDTNLRALCFDCHEKAHGRKRKRRFSVDVDGRISPP